MTVRFIRFIRGAKEPFAVDEFSSIEECRSFADQWASGLTNLEKFRSEGYILDEDDAILLTIPAELIETTFDTEVVYSGHSLSVLITKQAQMMGLSKGDVVNVTIRRIQQ